MNMYEKAFVERIGKCGIAKGPEFASLTKEAFEREWGGEGVELLTGLRLKTLEDPKKFASEMTKTYGEGAMQYFTLIVRYAESGKFRPEEEMEEEREEQELESVFKEVDSGAGGQP